MKHDLKNTLAELEKTCQALALMESHARLMADMAEHAQHDRISLNAESLDVSMSAMAHTLSKTQNQIKVLMSAIATLT